MRPTRSAFGIALLAIVSIVTMHAESNLFIPHPELAPIATVMATPAMDVAASVKSASLKSSRVPGLAFSGQTIMQQINIAYCNQYALLQQSMSSDPNTYMSSWLSCMGIGYTLLFG